MQLYLNFVLYRSFGMGMIIYLCISLLHKCHENDTICVLKLVVPSGVTRAGEGKGEHLPPGAAFLGRQIEVAC